MKGSLLILLCLNVAAAMSSQGASQVWARHYTGPGQGIDRAVAIAVDTVGDVYVTGTSTGNGGQTDFATIKYSSTGVGVWTNRYNGTANGTDQPAAVVALDQDGNVFVTGYSAGTGSGLDFVTIKYSTAGAPLWTNRFTSPGNGADYATALAVDSEGSVIVAGYASTIGAGYDFATIKYSNSGVSLWTNYFDSPNHADNFARAVAVDRSNNVFVAGDYATDRTVLGPLLTIAYSSDGVPIWTNYYGFASGGRSGLVGLAADDAGDVIMCGYRKGYETLHGTYDYVTIKYSNDGSGLWTNRFGLQTNTDEFAAAMALGIDGKIFVTGYITNAISPTGSDVLTVGYSPAGTPLWTNQYLTAGPYHDLPAAITVATSGNVYVAGTSDLSDFAKEYFTLAYASNGLPLWTNRYNRLVSLGFNGASAIAADGQNNVYVTGTSLEFASLDFTTIRYSPPPAIRLMAQHLNGSLVLTWTNADFDLQSAPNCTGVFTNIPGAASPYTNSPSGLQQFFRLISNE